MLFTVVLLVRLFTVCATCNAFSPVKHVCILHQHFHQSVCSAQGGCFVLPSFRALLVYCQVQSEWFQLPITTGLSLLLLLHHYPFSSGPVWTCLLIAPCRVCVSLFNGEREPAKPVVCLAVMARWWRARICVACAIKCFVENRSCYGAAGHGPQDCTRPAEGWVTMRTECTG